MATSQSTADLLVDQMSLAGAVSSRKMFGEYALYLDRKVVALLCNEKLYVKPTEQGRAFIGDVLEAPPYPGAKPYFLIEDEYFEDREFLSTLLRRTADALPPPKKKH